MRKVEVRMLVPQNLHRVWKKRAEEIGIPLATFVRMSAQSYISSTYPPEVAEPVEPAPRRGASPAELLAILDAHEDDA